MNWCMYHLKKNKTNYGIDFLLINENSIQINQPTRYNSFTSLLLEVYVWLNMFRAPLHPSSGAYKCTRSLWFYRWSLVVGALLVVIWQVNLPDHDKQLVKTCETVTSFWLIYVYFNHRKLHFRNRRH